MKIAIIGTGNVGGSLAKGFARSGHQVLLGSKQAAFRPQLHDGDRQYLLIAIENSLDHVFGGDEQPVTADVEPGPDESPSTSRIVR